MSEQPPNGNEKPILGEEECRRIADDLYARYRKELLENHNKPIDGNKWWYATGKGVIEDHIRQFTPEVLNHYWGHGITKGNEIDHLAAAISILANDAMRGSAAPLYHSGYVDAYTDGSFLIISHKGDQLIKRDENKRPQFVFLGENKSTGEGAKAIKINPGAFVVNAVFYPLVEELRRMFPDSNILYANQLPAYIREEEGLR